MPNQDPNTPPVYQREFLQLIHDRIEKLRPKLLDLGRRNPLISTKFSERSNSHVRFVDELPDVLYSRLREKSMKIIALPPLEEDPKDEKTKIFKSALADARITNEVYKRTLDSIDQNAEDVAQRLVSSERDLKDYVREQLGMPLRQTKSGLSIAQHAKNNNIEPSYDLPQPKDAHSDGRHDDDNIQTLLLPDILERRLSALTTKCKTWIEETGIDVMRVAFGFLEWTDTADSQSSFAPIVLVPVQIEKRRTARGFEFLVTGEGNTPEINMVLAEKLKIEYGITLPLFSEETSLEDYFGQVAKLSPRGMNWKVRRQVAIGVFPSARMAMYHDLNTKDWDFSAHSVIRNLFGGAERTSLASIFGDDYEVDEPSIEAKIPCVITDADSSQFSAIVDVMDGKSIAVEGPPGTGKSQTIVNAIGSILAQGKKVLFVAEKNAALEVVKSRLEACGLGPFLLTLQATRSTKEQVIESIRERMAVKNEREMEGLDEKIEQFRATRAKLHSYIKAMSTCFGATNITVHEILGRSIASRALLESMPDEVNRAPIPNLAQLNRQVLDEVHALSDQIEISWKEIEKNEKYWRGIGLASLDPFTANEILKKTIECASDYENAANKRELLIPLGINESVEHEQLKKLYAALSEIKKHELHLDRAMLLRIESIGAIQRIEEFLNKLEKADVLEKSLKREIGDPLSINVAKELYDLIEAVETLKIDAVSKEMAAIQISATKNELKKRTEAFRQIHEVLKVAPQASNVSIGNAVAICGIISNTTKFTLAIRRKEMENPAAREIVSKWKSKSEALQRTKSELENEFELKVMPDPQKLKGHLGALEAAGFFSIFKKEYRAAKQFYKNISKSKDFNRQLAVKNLKDLGAWMEEFDHYLKDQILLEMLGPHFDGLNTNYQAFELLLDFYDSVSNALKGIDNAPLRDFMRSGDIELLTSLPNISNDSNLSDYMDILPAELEKSLATIADSIKADEHALQIIQKQLVLICPENVSRARLGELLVESKLFAEHVRDIADSGQIQTFLGTKYQSLNTHRDDIVPTVAMAKLMVSLGESDAKVIRRAVQDDSVAEYMDAIFKATNAHEIAATSLYSMLELAQLDRDKYGKGMSRKVLAQYLKNAGSDKQGMRANTIYAANMKNIEEKGLGGVIRNIVNSGCSLEGLAIKMDAIIAQAMAREVYREHGKVLSVCDGNQLDGLRKRLAELDKSIIALSRKRLRCQLRKQANPPDGSNDGRRGEWTDMCLLENEISKKTRYIPVRDLTRRAARALLELKPCWMMSPLAVAQYIDKKRIGFDVVIIDEASQMTPEDAIGAISRASQSMVVGDTNQLPPSTFFQKFIENDDEEDEDAVAQESILEMANAVFRPARRLKWHYRSKHPGLIAFSNKFIYDNDLVIFPSPHDGDAGMGVSCKKIDGIYSSGTNPIEAKEIMDEAARFMKLHKDKSLGIVVLNQKQKDLLEQEWNYILANDADAQAYNEYWNKEKDGLESFFIKNLENVQGDERDVIFIGTVYGPEKSGGPVMQRFGPINGVTGKRRLNVLFTRAKRKIVTFSSMTAADIRADGANEGVFLLKKWLEYGATGQILVEEVTGAIRSEPDSPFEHFVIQQLRAMGCQTIPQVGVSGFYIDIGVKHPSWPHGFILGVECDGATYHSSKSARDRDRLRQEVLEGLGWSLHRIWSTDWFDNPIRETERLRTVISRRLDSLKILH